VAARNRGAGNAHVGNHPAAKPVALDVRVQAVTEAVVLDVSANTSLHMAHAAEAVAEARQLGDPALLARALFGAGCAAGYVAEAALPYLEEANALARQPAMPGRWHGSSAGKRPSPISPATWWRRGQQPRRA
jgi:hypothetical protein